MLTTLILAAGWLASVLWLSERIGQAIAARKELERLRAFHGL